VSAFALVQERLRAIRTRLGLWLASFSDPNREEGFWESVFRWWP
jgi:hypothetical protein